MWVDCAPDTVSLSLYICTLKAIEFEPICSRLSCCRALASNITLVTPASSYDCLIGIITSTTCSNS